MALRLTPRLFRHLLNWWPPYRGAGIRVTAISPDWHHVRVELRAGLRNRNYFGSHFGGSLYSMADPFYVLMLAHVLGPDYLIWDQAAEIEFLKPGRGVVSAEFHLEAREVERLRREAADGRKLLPEYAVEIRDPGGEVVARIRKRLYVRLKKRARPDAAPARRPED
jgi:acyl-coenzyme A thioesterase PaaI-like protein